MFFVTGDTHIPVDINKLSSSNFPAQKKLSKSDYVIICGDFGGVWSNDAEDNYWLNWLDKKNFTTLWVDGNHENFNLLKRYPITKWCGGDVQFINSSVIHLMRGQIFTIDGIRIFAMGGASSHDKLYRVEGKSWWGDELPSKKEYEEALNNLDCCDWNVDYVISHCCATEVAQRISSWYEKDDLTTFFSSLKTNLKYSHWYFGHYHTDMNIDNKHTVVYNEIKTIKSF